MDRSGEAEPAGGGEVGHAPDLVAAAVSKLLNKKSGEVEYADVLGLEEAVAKEVRRLLPTARAWVGAPLTSTQAGLPDGVYELDGRLAEFFESEGLREAAAEVRRRGTRPGRAEKWAKPEHLEYALALALLPRVHLQIEAHRRKPAGLITDVARSITLATTRGLYQGPDASGQLAILRPNPIKPKYGDPVVVAELPKPSQVPAVAPEVFDLAQGLRLVGGRLVWPFLEWLIETAHRQAISGAERPDIITVYGGWEAVAAAVLEIARGEVHPRERSELRALARALGSVPIRWIDGARSSSLLTVYEDAAAAGRGRGRSEITFKLIDRLIEGETFRARKKYGPGAGPEQWAGWRIVPLVRPRNITPIPQSPRDTFGPQAVYVRLLQMLFTRRGDQLLESGLVTVEQADRFQLASEAQLPGRLVDPLHDHLVEKNVIVANGIRCAPADQIVRDFISDGWKRSADASEQAKHNRQRSQRRRRR